MSEPYVLITGASAGIGAALAHAFARRKHAIVLVARRKQVLAELAQTLRDDYGVEVLTMPFDLAKKRAPARLLAKLEAQQVTVDVLVNNAGAAGAGEFAQMDAAEVDAMVALNVRALTSLTRLFLPGMVERGAGRILNVASVLAFQPTPSMAVYAATKAFVLSFSEALSEELRGKGVTVTALCPGLTRTDMARDTRLPPFLAAEPAAVAEEGYHACMNGEVIRVPGAVNQMALAWSELQPRWLVRSMAGYLGRAAGQSSPKQPQA